MDPTIQPLNYTPRRFRKKFPYLKLLALVVVLIICGTSIYFLWTSQLNPLKKDTAETYRQVTQSNRPAPDFSKWQFYQNPDNGFSIRIPPEWMINEKRDSRNNSLGEIMFSPSEQGELYGSINTIIIKNIADGEENKPLTTKNEFDAWYSSTTKEEGTITKLDTATIAEQQGVIYLDKSQEDGYNLNAWFRKDKRNYYITVTGNKNIDDEDIYAFRNLLNTIKFISK